MLQLRHQSRKLGEKHNYEHTYLYLFLLVAHLSSLTFGGIVNALFLSSHSLL